MSCKKSYFYRDDFNGRFMTMRYNSGLSLPVVGFHRRKNGQFYIPTPSETAFQAVAPVILTRRDCSIISTWKSAPLENLEMFGFSSDVLMLNPDDYSSDIWESFEDINESCGSIGDIFEKASKYLM